MPFTPLRPRRAKRALIGALAASVAGLLATSVAASTTNTPSTASATASLAAAGEMTREGTAAQSIPATGFRLASFNVLGADHTAPGGKRKGWDTGVVRIGRVVELITQENLDVVGFQEFQPPQAQRFSELTGPSWQTFPGLDPAAGAPSVNSIAWRTDTWTLISANTLPVPYFSGVPSRMPYVLLQNVATGRQVWFFNTHNPADVRGPAQAWRDEGFAMEAKLANDLRAVAPGTPFVSFGDKNDSARYYCAVAPVANLWSASGGYVDGSTCSAPPIQAIDWIMGTKDVFFNSYRRRQDAFVRATSDHPLYMANAVVPASSPAPIEHVVVVAVPGLTTPVLRAVADRTKALNKLVAEGASTTRARTTVERVGADANLVSVLTGRRVSPGSGGHGIEFGRKPVVNVHKAAGQYVSSIFDLAHNNSFSTTLVSARPDSALVRKSWNRSNGGSDPYGKPDGTAKIDSAKVLKNDYAAAKWWRAEMTKHARKLSVIELSGAMKQGELGGYKGADYQQAVVKVDRAIAQIQRSVRYDPVLRDRTLLVVVGTQGATRRKKTNLWHQSYQVPMYVTGPGVPAGTGLYTLNPAYLRPSRDQPTYAGVQPIRTGDVANLVMRALRLPPVPGSTMNTSQLMQAFDPLTLPTGG
jgi:endonuclease/exonuclease/phosphatase family metal-dependent hydrolase